MCQILHLSDSHGQTETMVRLENLADLCSESDVVAHTGDCTSANLQQIPLKWNAWPQRLKFLVPGNHERDRPHAFDLLTHWLHAPRIYRNLRANTPWHEDVDLVTL